MRLFGRWPLLALALYLPPGVPLPPLLPGQTVVLEPGRHLGPWTIEAPGVRLLARPGAILDGGGRGSALVLSGEGIVVEGLRVENVGLEDDFYEPDAAIWLWKCHRCRVLGLEAQGVTAGVRVEGSRGVEVRGSRLSGTGRAPGITAFRSDDLVLKDNLVEGFLDNIYVEYGERVLLEGNRTWGAGRYGLHLMFTYRARVVGNESYGNGVGSALMHGAENRVEGNLFAREVGPLRYGLMFQEEWRSEARANRFLGNTIGLLSLDSRDTRLLENRFEDNGIGLLFARETDRNTLWAKGNAFRGNLYDLAVDDPEAKVRLQGNLYDRASPLPVPHLPSSSFALLLARQPDLSLFALSPGVMLYEAAEARVPGLRLLGLLDEEARPLGEGGPPFLLWGLALLGVALWWRR